MRNKPSIAPDIAVVVNNDMYQESDASLNNTVGVAVQLQVGRTAVPFFNTFEGHTARRLYNPSILNL